MQAVSASLLDTLRSLLGTDAVIVAADELAFLSADAWAAGPTVALALRPAGRAGLAEAVAAITAAGIAVIPRGGGMSYTGGYVPVIEPSAIVDLGRLDSIVDVSADDMTITVEAGVTWAQIHAALAGTGLRLPFFGTFSGARATVGGGMSNGALFMGTGRYGTAADIVVGLEVIAADGRTIVTGQAGFANGRPYYRNYGPDLTGLFVHDAGALGIKTLVSMKLMPVPAVEASASFVFADGAAAAAALTGIARSGLAEEAYVFDPQTNRRSLDQASLATDLKRLAAVARSAGGIAKGIAAGAKLVGAGRRFMPGDVWSLHVVCSGSSDAGVGHDLDTARAIVDGHGGGEIANSIPLAARANPFEPVNGIVGPDGERWAALNAKVAHSQSQGLIADLGALLATHDDAMRARGVSCSFLYIAIGTQVFSIEPVLRWHDSWLPVHRRTPEPAYLDGIDEPAANPDARTLVANMRREIVDLFARHGVGSTQVGKTYPYFDSLQPDTQTLLLALKASLDPAGLMNPGALSLPLSVRDG